jgi:hypothetical protein
MMLENMSVIVLSCEWMHVDVVVVAIAPMGKASRTIGSGERLSWPRTLGCSTMFPGAYQRPAQTLKANMIQQRSLSLLSSAERHLLRQNRQQCLRCFHTSKPNLAAEESSSNKGKGNDNGAPYNAPNRGPNRQERAAKASSEISALAADLPKANANGRNAEVEGAQPKSPQSASPQAQSQAVPASGSMGENDSARKEGPLSQGAGGVAVGTAEDAGSPKQALKSNDTTTPTPSTATPTNTKPSTQSVSPTTKSSSKKPSTPTASTYLSAAPGTSTLLGSAGAANLILDRGALLSPHSTPKNPTTAEIAHRLRHHPKQITAFRTLAEKQAYTKPLRDLHAKERSLTLEAKKAQEENGTIPAALKNDIRAVRRQARQHVAFRPLPETVQQGIINRMVLGKYDEQGLLSGKQVHRQPQLNTVAQELLKNSTYLAKDSEKLISKLRGLLPSAAAAAAKKAPAAKAKA